MLRCVVEFEMLENEENQTDENLPASDENMEEEKEESNEIKKQKLLVKYFT